MQYQATKTVVPELASGAEGSIAIQAPYVVLACPLQGSCAGCP